VVRIFYASVWLRVSEKVLPGAGRLFCSATLVSTQLRGLQVDLVGDSRRQASAAARVCN